ncbi:glycosyltransferase family 4 protein [Aquipseudomonas alcaligenes]|uniref:Glycosyltransferase WbpZ n=1 Tax=Aquipseudomonas alcaligenes TaxID=43263 RepID=A0AA37FPN3_AQUAC|nr:glycosyltransferase family 4 protein [Pseudomonas alcaligenes]BCR22681.1 glycosyltransferase WbpZ [Pseudomonas alcaligenes]GIZ67962.1 glycosyltransferase WbpZ [Pseudomonas alcaligenes]GIZ72477.1 glycosyltransferase WbpZ [Pseudomonas alcaligenes]GIZ76806.1 glycosyltransferase WbpZ [Pseudomonas alcaligenes]GIZ80938.1 glycosyltransferase WbpZ [Pseudomonas alcaligenes]
MKVLHFFKTYLPETVGGIEQVIYQLCESTGAQGVEAQVLTLSTSQLDDSLVGSHPVYRAKLDLQVASTGFSFSAIGRLRALAAQADLVHYHFPWPFMDVAHVLAGVEKPYVVSYHSDIVRQKYLLHLYRPLMHRFLSKAERIIAASPNYLESSEVLQGFRDKTQVIPYGLDEAIYPKPSEARLEHWRARLGSRFFLFVGVLRYYKGLHILLEAVADTGYPLVIVGAGPMEQELRGQAAALKLTNVHFVGRVDEDDKCALLQLCSAFAFPSHLRSEAFGISLLEAAMYGKPLISCEIGSGTSYININGETGLVVPPASPEAFRDAMRTLWEQPLLAEQMGAKAGLRYSQLFTAELMGRQMTQVYREVLAR